MQITNTSIETAAGPSEWFTGAVYATADRAGACRLRSPG